jgi:hypothetical protein
MSLDPICVWPQRYVLKCARRNDLDENLGTLPDHSIYIGSSSGISHRLCFHFTPNCGTLFTKKFPPECVIGLDRPNADCGTITRSTFFGSWNQTSQHAASGFCGHGELGQPNSASTWPAATMLAANVRERHAVGGTPHADDDLCKEEPLPSNIAVVCSLSYFS